MSFRRRVCVAKVIDVKSGFLSRLDEARKKIPLEEPDCHQTRKTGS